jgi:hypothetical protein
MCSTHHAAQTQWSIAALKNIIVLDRGLPDVSGKCLACDRGAVYFIDKTRGVEILIKHQALAQNGQICDFSRLG